VRKARIQNYSCSHSFDSQRTSRSTTSYAGRRFPGGCKSSSIGVLVPLMNCAQIWHRLSGGLVCRSLVFFNPSLTLAVIAQIPPCATSGQAIHKGRCTRRAQTRITFSSALTADSLADSAFGHGRFRSSWFWVCRVRRSFHSTVFDGINK
jgi:hypothetical protein